ncbi:hypothetical protein C8F04DRAFT_944528 [Mycena alexandri]|uniref:Phosphoglucomutase n=1 Tax=Mycena alexandri TaxID=1745969 RepID=A0AAD6XB31_9AGAR|nr:hypothetical protein C8F04DRAFT_944528 [Mycena alexandri]
MEPASLESLVKEWLDHDKNEATHSEIQQLWNDGKTAELEQRMRPRIEFGTAGLRGKMQAGWACMNDLIVIQASQGLCQYVLKNVENAASRGVVIGHDHRHNSERWAQLTAAVFVNSGFKAYLHRGLVHTPMVPFTVQALTASCGIMITASHNPKEDNGYKVYWENAVQIIGPHDKGISASIKENLAPKTWTIEQLHLSPLCLDRTQEMKDAYFSNLSSLNLSRSLNGESKIKFVNTSIHGVSDAFVSRAFESFGFPPFIPVKEQQQPDPEFPTVAFPNPEEKGALDLALRTADTQGANYVLSQDPDSDRFCAAEKRRDGQWTVFTGDQLGALFAAQILDQYKASGKPIEKLAMVASTVSSKMIEAMAEKEGFKFVECLTGFKFIGNTALNLVEQGFEVPFGYEEAIGYMFGFRIRDKDGVAATVSFAELVTALVSQGKTVQSYLDGLYQRQANTLSPSSSRAFPLTHVVFTHASQTSNSYFVCKNPSTIDKIFERLRNYNVCLSESNTKPAYPREIAGMAITSVIDLTTGYDSTNPPTYKPSLPLSSGHMIQFRAVRKEDGTKMVLTTRTSGTEPKIKYYIEANAKDAAAAQDALVKVVQELGTTWMEADKHQLGRP